MNKAGNPKKIKVLIISAIIPIEKSGAGCLTMLRHFVHRDDFKIAVASARDFSIRGVDCMRIRQSFITERLRRSRFTRWVANLDYVRNWYALPKNLIEFAEKFNPDVVFSVVDDWHMGLAWQVSRKLGVPLAVDFQDLFALSEFESKMVRPFYIVKEFLLYKYHFLNRRAEQVFHVGGGMREWFKPPHRGDILYPIPHKFHTINKYEPLNSNSITILYAGNSRGAYGRMLVRLARALDGNPKIQLKIFTGGTDIGQIDLDWMKMKGIYIGYLPPDELVSEYEKADAFLLLMSFEPKERPFMLTSFNTKWSDYISHRKPIFVWGPNYSTAVKFANEHGAGTPIVVNEPKQVIDEISNYAAKPEKCHEITQGIRSVAENILNADKIQDILFSKLQRFYNYREHQ